MAENQRDCKGMPAEFGQDCSEKQAETSGAEISNKTYQVKA